MLKKYNQKFLKAKNQSRILKILKQDGPSTRAQLAKNLGIARSTVSEICNEMVFYKILNEGKKIDGNLGKRPILINFNKNYYYLIIVVITSSETNIVVSNLIGEIISEDVIDYQEETISAKEIIELAFKKIDEIINNLGLEKICLISLGSPETLDIKTGKIKWAPYIKDWMGVDLKELFYEKYKIDVIVKDHVKLETIGEQWKSYNNTENLIYIVVTYGIGSGAIIDGKLREGKNGYLGEIAFLPISEEINYDELLKGNKNLGYFESQCDIKKIIEIVNKYLSGKYGNKNYKKIKNFSEVKFLYNTEKEITDIVNNSVIKTLALGIASIIVVLDPEIVVINGEIVELGNDFLKLLKTEIYKIIPYRIEVVFSELRERSRIFGAIKNGLDYIDRQIDEDPENFYKISSHT